MFKFVSGSNSYLFYKDSEYRAVKVAKLTPNGLGIKKQLPDLKFNGDGGILHDCRSHRHGNLYYIFCERSGFGIVVAKSTNLMGPYDLKRDALVPGRFDSPNIVKGFGDEGHVLVYGKDKKPYGVWVSCLSWKNGWPVANKCKSEYSTSVTQTS